MPKFSLVLPRIFKPTFLSLLFLLSISGSFSSYAIDGSSITKTLGLNSADKPKLEDMVKTLKKVHTRLSSGRYDSQYFAKWTSLTINIESAANLCVTEKEKTLEELNATIDSLGESLKTEVYEVTKSRKDLIESKHDLNAEIAECNLHLLASEETSALLSKAKQNHLENTYFVRGPDFITLARDFIFNPTNLFNESTEFLWQHAGIRSIDFTSWVVGSVIVTLLFLLSLRSRTILLRIEGARTWNDDIDNLLLRAVITTSAKFLPWLIVTLASASVLYYFTRGVTPTPFITELGLGLAAYTASVFTLYLILNPWEPAKPYLHITRDTAKKLAQRLKMLLLLCLVGYLAFYTIFTESLAETNILLLRNIFSFFVVLNIIWTIRAVLNAPNLANLYWISRTVNIILPITLIMKWMGYTKLAHVIFTSVLTSFILLIACLIASKIFAITFNELDKGTRSVSRLVRKKLAVEEGNVIPGMIWLRFISSFLIWGFFLLTIINIWDYSGSLLAQIQDYLINGFEIGDFRIVPGKILWAVLLFIGFLTFSGWFKSQLENKWLKMTNMNSGARDALTTILGYIFFIVAVLIGLSAAGFDFGNLAIIAGALSVGIGFGLQNIVNNFVSGLVLLFERPIRKGDWIVVGGTEGHVKNIQIRSTLIKTFDNSDVIVPNSELISNQVTNWILSSKHGRSIVKVGVAYGSDVELVRDTLLEVASNNEDLIHDTPGLSPWVLFKEFGDSALNFELRVNLKDIESRLSVTSNLHYAVNKAFTEANIEIAFPQTDIHVRTLPSKTEE